MQVRPFPRRASDIDIALEAAAPLPIELMAEIRDALEESDVVPRVDVVNLMRASSELRRRVRQEGIEWPGGPRSGEAAIRASREVGCGRRFRGPENGD